MENGTRHRRLRCKNSLRAGTLSSGSHLHCREACSNVGEKEKYRCTAMDVGEKEKYRCTAMDSQLCGGADDEHLVNQSAQYLQSSPDMVP